MGHGCNHKVVGFRSINTIRTYHLLLNLKNKGMSDCC